MLFDSDKKSKKNPAQLALNGIFKASIS